MLYKNIHFIYPTPGTNRLNIFYFSFYSTFIMSVDFIPVIIIIIIILGAFIARAVKRNHKDSPIALLFAHCRLTSTSPCSHTHSSVST